MYHSCEPGLPSTDETFAVIDANPFAIIIIQAPDGIVVSHLPVLLDRAQGPAGTLMSHIASTDSHAELIRRAPEMTIIFHGAYSGVSLSMLANTAYSAPARKIAAVHCHGIAHAMGDTATARHLAAFGDRLASGRGAQFHLNEVGTGSIMNYQSQVLGFKIRVAKFEIRYTTGHYLRVQDQLGNIRAFRNTVALSGRDSAGWTQPEAGAGRVVNIREARPSQRTGADMVAALRGRVW